MSKILRSAVAILLLAMDVKVSALALIPMRIRNDCPVPIRIVVTRFADCLGPEKSRTGEWTVETTLAPQQNGTILLMGGAEGLCSGGVRRITIETAPAAAADHKEPVILPLSITDNFPNHWFFLHVQVGVATNRFVLRAVETAR